MLFRYLNGKLGGGNRKNILLKIYQCVITYIVYTYPQLQHTFSMESILANLETILARYFQWLERKGKAFNFALGVAFMIIAGVADVMAPEAYMFGFLYMITIAFTTWFAGKKAGLIISVCCTALWATDRIIADIYPYIWNVLSALVSFCIVSILLSKMRMMFELERTLSRRDPLTGVMSLRAFSEFAEYEILRHRRKCSPFSVAYLDLDNFKLINDRFGHKKGDELLKVVVKCLVANLRNTDVIARMGGDEFMIFFPETNQIAAKVVTQKVKEGLLQLSVDSKWPTTFSMGVLTCTQGDCSLDEVISRADKLMYEVKDAGKNDVRYAEFQMNTAGALPV